MPLSAHLAPRTRALVFLLLLAECLAKRGTNGRKSLYNGDAKLVRARMGVFWRLVKYVFIAVFVPAIISFLYSLATDPAVPQILRASLAAMNERFATSLSQTKRVKRR